MPSFIAYQLTGVSPTLDVGYLLTALLLTLDLEYLLSASCCSSTTQPPLASSATEQHLVVDVTGDGSKV